ncbi:hypothetical protein [Neptuniibacter sp. QD48_11]|uniref:hypothetical protein n=1 Tax=Neptuniibacter sp. QD48_11 TaxID=3398211 RepID=UPI0039F5F45C
MSFSLKIKNNYPLRKTNGIFPFDSHGDECGDGWLPLIIIFVVVGQSYPVRKICGFCGEEVSEVSASEIICINTTLIQCTYCTSEIASIAEACPQCGAPNEWIHPRLVEFLEVESTELVPQECYLKVKHDQLYVC